MTNFSVPLSYDDMLWIWSAPTTKAKRRPAIIVHGVLLSLCDICYKMHKMTKIYVTLDQKDRQSDVKDTRTVDISVK